MNYTLQLHGERMLYPTPPGLYELMSDVTREVLRDQPTQVYEYIARYLDTLVRVREYARVGEGVVGDVLQQNSELLAYVRSLGVSWAEANTAASKVQRAFRTHRCRQELRRKVKSSTRSQSYTESFIRYLENLGVNLDQAERATVTIQHAYKSYRVKKDADKGHKPKTKDASTHTIEEIELKSFAKSKKPYKRDSKRLVYQQTPRHSDESTWSTLKRDMDEEEASRKITKRLEGEDDVPGKIKPFTLVYEQDKSTNYKYVPKLLKSDFTTVPSGRVSLPSYYNENEEKIPMISESGLLLHEESEDAVTLFSSDSVDDDVRRRSRGSSFPSYPTVTNLEFGPRNEELAKELFEIIGPAHPTTTETVAATDTNILIRNPSIMKKALSKASSAEAQSVPKKSTVVEVPLHKKSLAAIVGRPTLRMQGSETEKKDSKEEDRKMGSTSSLGKQFKLSK